MKKRFKKIWITIISTIIMVSVFATNAFAMQYYDFDHGAGWYSEPSLWYDSSSGSMSKSGSYVSDDGHWHTTGYASEGTVVYGSDRNGSSQHWDDNYTGSTIGYGYNSMCDWDDDDDDGGGGGGGGGDDDDDDDYEPTPWYCWVYYWKMPGEAFNIYTDSWYSWRGLNCQTGVGYDSPGYVSVVGDIPTREGYDFKGWKCSENGQTYHAGNSLSGYDVSYNLTAIWEPKPINIVYDKNLGTGIIFSYCTNSSYH